MDPTKYLDQLDEAREKATPGEWMADSHELYVNLGAALDGIPGDWIGETCRVDDPRSDADAALIVAAVNALPKLTAALRAVLDLAAALDIDAAEDAIEAESDTLDPVDAARKLGQSEGQAAAADALRAALAVSA